MAGFGWEWIVGSVILIFLLGFLLGRRGGEGRDPSAPPSSVTAIPRRVAPRASAPDLATLDPATRDAIGRAMAAGQKIEAIKLLRDATRLSLKDAKEAVEAMEREGGGSARR